MTLYSKQLFDSRKLMKKREVNIFTTKTMLSISLGLWKLADRWDGASEHEGLDIVRRELYLSRIEVQENKTCELRRSGFLKKHFCTFLKKRLFKLVLLSKNHELIYLKGKDCEQFDNIFTHLREKWEVSFSSVWRQSCKSLTHNFLAMETFLWES